MKQSQFLICLLIFLTCVFVYLGNGQALTSSDDIPNSLLAFNWLENRVLNFDIFRDSQFYSIDINTGELDPPYFFLETENGHVSSPYPIGPAIITFPIYLVFYFYLKLTVLFTSMSTQGLTGINYALELTDKSFLDSREAFDTLAATLVVSLSAVLFYLISRIKFSQPSAIFSTFIYAFATSTWVVCSQGIRQNSMSNFALLATILAIIKLNRVNKKFIPPLLLVAGFWSGLLPACRPTSLVFLVPIFVYIVLIYRQQALFFCLGLTSMLFGIGWNIYFFGLGNAFSGGYTDHFGEPPYSINVFFEAFSGLLLSPNRGWIILSPVLLFSIPGFRTVFHRKTNHEEKLFAGLSISCLILFLHYCLYTRWAGISVYGPSRFLIDTLPVLCLLTNYFLDDHFRKVIQRNFRLFNLKFVVFLIFLFISTYVQLVGAFSARNWDRFNPYSLYSRIWNVEDMMVARASKEIYNNIFPPIDNPRQYGRGLSGQFLEIKDSNDDTLSHNYRVEKGDEDFVTVHLENNGNSRWYGYDFGAERITQIVNVSFTPESNLKDNSSQTNSSRLLVKGVVEPGDTGIALGEIDYPNNPGTYTMNFTLSNKVTRKTRDLNRHSFVIDVVDDD